MVASRDDGLGFLEIFNSKAPHPHDDDDGEAVGPKIRNDDDPPSLALFMLLSHYHLAFSCINTTYCLLFNLILRFSTKQSIVHDLRYS